MQAVVSPWPEYDLSGFFHANLVSEDAVRYRQEVLRDLEQPPVLEAVRGFTVQLREMRRQLQFAPAPEAQQTP